MWIAVLVGVGRRSIGGLGGENALQDPRNKTTAAKLVKFGI
jgi:hypothetical protein